MTESGASRVAVVTGGAGGIGAAVLRRLHTDGYYTVGLDRRPSPDADRSLDVDVTDPDAVQEAFADIAAREGRIDTLVLAAGTKIRGTVPNLTADEFDTAYAVNVRSVFLCVTAALDTLKNAEKPSIVTLGSASAHAEAGALAYSAAKGAVLSMTRSLALDLRSEGIRVNSVLPGFTATPMAVDLSDHALAAKSAETVRGRLNQPEDVANVVAFLASDHADIISGAIVDVAHIQGDFVRPVTQNKPRDLS